jgi:hypothetical protein
LPSLCPLPRQSQCAFISFTSRCPSHLFFFSSIVSGYISFLVTMHRLLLNVFVLLIGTFVVSQALPQPLSARSSETTVVTLAGPITGLKVSSSMYQFLGIPYAESPTGTARFEAPTAYPISLEEFFHFGGPSDPHSINATAFGSMCPQASGGEENCLFLNVYTGTINPLALRPVMFWYLLSTLEKR